MTVSIATFERLALEDPEGRWELHCGRPRRKPSMTMPHNDIERVLGFRLQSQLPIEEYRVSQNAPHARRLPPFETPGTYFIPDVCVIPAAYLKRFEGSDELEAYDDPLPLVVEIWSRSTGDYDVESKLPEYMRRGDLEIWLIHPLTLELHAWRRQPDGSYTETVTPAGAYRSFRCRVS